MSDADIQVSVENVSFGYDGELVLANVTFPITRGDFLAIIGPNGSGKTTLIRIILGLLRPREGRVLVLGEDAALFSHKSRLGYVPQKAVDMGPNFPATVGEVVGLGLISRKSFPRFFKRRDAKKVADALKKVGMAGFTKRRIGALSGGELQRVLIARAIVNEPEILFLDEPTHGVDAQSQKEFYDMLDELNRDHGITVVLVTHDIGILTAHANKVACLNQSLVFHGTHEDFCNSRVVQELLRGEFHLVCHRH